MRVQLGDDRRLFQLLLFTTLYTVLSQGKFEEGSDSFNQQKGLWRIQQISPIHSARKYSSNFKIPTLLPSYVHSNVFDG